MTVKGKTLSVDSAMIDMALDELTKLILLLDKNPKITRKENGIHLKEWEIPTSVQDAVKGPKVMNIRLN